LHPPLPNRHELACQGTLQPDSTVHRGFLLPTEKIFQHAARPLPRLPRGPSRPLFRKRRFRPDSGPICEASPPRSLTRFPGRPAAGLEDQNQTAVCLPPPVSKADPGTAPDQGSIANLLPRLPRGPSRKSPPVFRRKPICGGKIGVMGNQEIRQPGNSSLIVSPGAACRAGCAGVGGQKLSGQTGVRRRSSEVGLHGEVPKGAEGNGEIRAFGSRGWGWLPRCPGA